MRRLVSKTAPSPAHLLRVRFDGKIELVGYDVSPAEPAAGQRVRVIWHWKSVRALGEEGWRLFTHLGDAAGAGRMNLDEEGTIRRLYPPSEWKAGEWVRDEQRFELPEDWTSNEAVLDVGVWRADARLPAHVGAERRATDRATVRLRTRVAAPARPPRMKVPRATGGIDLDGRRGEADWERAARTGRFVHTQTGRALPTRTEARLLWTDDTLWVHFEGDDDDIHSAFRGRDDSLWQEDAFELFLDPGADGRDYYELQVSPRNVVFDSFLPRYRQNRNGWTSGVRTAVRLDGSIDDGDGDRGWSAEMGVPWQDVGFASPPTPGVVVRANLFRMDWREGSVRAAAWSPPRRPDFHTLERFGELELLP